MSVVHAGGTYVNFTFTGTLKQDIINNAETQLNTAGWTTISGSGTTNLLMESVATGDALQYRVRFRDDGGTCVHVYIESTDGSLKPASYTVNNGGCLIPGAITYRILATRYWFIIYSGNPTTSRQFVWCGTLYQPFNAGVTRCAFLSSNAVNDSDGTSRSHIRNSPNYAIQQFGDNGNYELMLNAAWWEIANSGNVESVNYIGTPRLVINCLVPDFQQYLPGSVPGWRYTNGDIVTGDVFMAWGLTWVTMEALIRGQVYDCLYINDSQAMDLTCTISGHNYINLTNSNAGAAPQYPRGGLWFAYS